MAQEFILSNVIPGIYREVSSYQNDSIFSLYIVNYFSITYHFDTEIEGHGLEFKDSSGLVTFWIFLYWL